LFLAFLIIEDIAKIPTANGAIQSRCSNSAKELPWSCPEWAIDGADTSTVAIVAVTDKTFFILIPSVSENVAALDRYDGAAFLMN
jgi:hypothetical protein